MNKAVNQYVLNDADWFSGAVFNFDIECIDFTEDCYNQKITLQNTVEKNEYDIDFIGNANDIFFDEVDTQKVYVLNQDTVYVLGKDL